MYLNQDKGGERGFEKISSFWAALLFSQIWLKNYDLCEEVKIIDPLNLSYFIWLKLIAELIDMFFLSSW